MNAQHDAAIAQAQAARIATCKGQLWDALMEANALSDEQKAEALSGDFLRMMRRVGNNALGHGATNYGALLAQDARNKTLHALDGDGYIIFRILLHAANNTLELAAELDPSSIESRRRSPEVKLFITAHTALLMLKSFVYDAVKFERPTATPDLIAYLAENPSDKALLVDTLRSGKETINRLLTEDFMPPAGLHMSPGDHPAATLDTESLLRMINAKIMQMHRESEALKRIS